MFTGPKCIDVSKSEVYVVCIFLAKLLLLLILVRYIFSHVVKEIISFPVQASFMQWIVDKVPDQSLLNTGGWRFIVPQLYKKYPNDDMNLNISLSSPPVMRIARNNIDAVINLDLVIDVLEAGKVIPVACVTLVSLLMGEMTILVIFILQSVLSSFIIILFY